jgi:FkbM family methyltransferase
MLHSGHIDSLELLDLIAGAGVNVIYDIGANVGTWSLLAKSIIPNAKIHAFEPLPEHADAFARACTGLNDIILHHVALGSENSTATLHVTDFSDASSLLPIAEAGRLHFGIQEAGRFATTVRRLDDYRAEKQLPWPDVLKLDVQGYELEVLKGATECLMHAKAVIAEVSFVVIYEEQCLFEGVVELMKERGFRLHALGVNTSLGRPLVQTDALFVSSRQ